MDTSLKTAPDDALDLDSLLTPAIASVGGGLSVLSGGITALTSAQTLSVVYIDGAAAVVPYLLLALGIATVVAGAKLLGGHGWAAIAATSLNGLLFFATCCWLVYSFFNGYFSLLALANPGLAVIAGGLSVAAIKPCARVTAARKASEQPSLFKSI